VILNGVLIVLNGKIVAVGSAVNQTNSYDFALARYLSNGTIDTTFGVAGKVRTDFGHTDFEQTRSALFSLAGKSSRREEQYSITRCPILSLFLAITRTELWKSVTGTVDPIFVLYPCKPPFQTVRLMLGDLTQPLLSALSCAR